MSEPSGGSESAAVRTESASVALARVRSIPTRWIAVSAVVIWLVSGAYMLHFGSSWHLDLRVYRAAVHSLYHHGSPFTAEFTANHLPFTYTPFALLALSPVEFGPLGLVETLWWIVSGAAMVTSLFLMLRAEAALASGRAWAVAGLMGGVASLALEPVRSNFDYGQINLILMVMIVADLTWVRPPWRGVLVGIAAAVKLTPLVFIAYFLVARDRGSFLRSLGTFVLLGAASWAVLPSDSDRFWLHQATDAGRTGVLGVVSNQSWNGVVHRAPFDGGHLGTVVWVILSLLTLGLGIALTRVLVQQARTADAVMALALTELLVSPVSWSHHWSWLVLAPIVAVSLWSVHRSVAIVLLVLVGLAVSAPYLWIHSVPLSYLGSNALVVGGAVALVMWAVAERALHRHSWNRAPTTIAD
jgi:alpha-1,2-mannosyltransferase